MDFGNSISIKISLDFKRIARTGFQGSRSSPFPGNGAVKYPFQPGYLKDLQARGFWDKKAAFHESILTRILEPIAMTDWDQARGEGIYREAMEERAERL